MALELHILSNRRHFKAVSELLDILFGHESDFEEDDGLVDKGASCVPSVISVNLTCYSICFTSFRYRYRIAKYRRTNITVLLAETLLTSITKLREDRHYQMVLKTVLSETQTRVPWPLRDCTQFCELYCRVMIVENNRVELVRGNLYAALINYVRLVASSTSSERQSSERQSFDKDK